MKRKGRIFLMKFFKQTKETKRKISFFMALAMIISLLPVSPYAKAATKSGTDPKVTVNCTVTGVTSAAVEKKTGTNVSGAVIITLKADSGYIFNDKSNIHISTGSAAEKGTITTDCAVSGSSIGENNSQLEITTPSSIEANATTYEITVSNINSDITVTITGNATKKDTATPTPTVTPITEPTETPTKAPTATPSTSPTQNPAGTATPKPTFKVKISKGTLGDGIGFTATSDDKDVTFEAGTNVKELNVVEGTKITLSVDPTDTNKQYIWAEKPVLAVTSGAVTEAEWEQTEGSLKLTYVLTVKAETEISVSGGSLQEVTEDTVNKVVGTIPDEVTVTDEEGKTINVGIDTTTADNTAVFNAIMDALQSNNATAGAITLVDKNGAKSEVTIADVVKALEKKDDSASIKTEVKVQIASNSFTSTATSTSSIASSANKDNIEVKDDNGNKTTISLKDNEVKSMLTSGDVYDITVESILTMGKGDNAKIATVKVENLGGAIKITMPVPKKAADAPCVEGKTRYYFAIRVHGEGNKQEVTLIPCEYNEETGEVSFSSSKFSTYIISYVDKDKTPSGTQTPSDPTPTPTAPATQTPGGSSKPPVYPGPGGSGGGGGYVPAVSPSPSAKPSASPSTTPSAAPSGSAAPGTTPSAAPGDNTTGVNTPSPSTAPSKQPATGDGNDKETGGNGTKTNVKVGKKVTVNSSKYKVTSVSGTRAVQFTQGKKNAKSVTIPATVKISGKKYKVTAIANNAFKDNKKLKKVTIGTNVNKIGKAAFKGCKNLKSVVIKTKKLTAKKVGANAFKGINKKAVFKVPKKKVKAYKKIVKAKGAGKKVTVKK